MESFKVGGCKQAMPSHLSAANRKRTVEVKEQVDGRSPT